MVVNRVSPILALDTLITSITIIKDMASMSWLFNDNVVNIIKKSINPSRQSSVGKMCCFRETSTIKVKINRIKNTIIIDLGIPCTLR